MRNRTHQELVAILLFAARSDQDELEAVVAELKAEGTDRQGGRADRRRSAAVDKALAVVTDTRSPPKAPARIRFTHHARGDKP